MIEATSKATLKSGETVDFSIVKAPDPDWAPKLMRLLGHKMEAMITRLLGVILAALAVQFVLDGIERSLL